MSAKALLKPFNTALSRKAADDDDAAMYHSIRIISVRPFLRTMRKTEMVTQMKMKMKMKMKISVISVRIFKMMASTGYRS